MPTLEDSAQEIAVGDQFNSLLAPARLASIGQGQDAQLGFARLPQSGIGGAQIGVVVAGMADELPCAVWNTAAMA